MITGYAFAQGVQRCESPDGKVTYANVECPPGTQSVRKLDDATPPSAVDQKDAKERLARDAKQVEGIERLRKQAEAKQARDRATAEEKARKKAAECKKLDLKSREAKEDFERAALAKKADAERKFKRADAMFRLNCEG